ncbi:hypothetical protein KC19_3G025200 [Ceratodon purpureus]|uniref:DUF7748 domain-containing protein n=1 Tax=Ceratodon purpureus TaxID=3225 RepID=A0A8T0IHF3_CERPU|nr:hypothetical protein KC19_3G025200 [Ceratodon purpureus]
MAGSNKIVLRNDLEYSVSIKEGNAGHFRVLTVLGPGKTFSLKIDPNATYREYLFITLPDETSLDVVSSDDFAEWKEIKIYEDNKKFYWMGTKKRSGSGSVQELTQAQEVNTVPTTAHEPGLFKKILNRFGF